MIANPLRSGSSVMHRGGLHMKLLGVHRRLYEDMNSAIAREKQMKKWHRAWKIELIEKDNRDWRDVWPDIVEITSPGTLSIH